MRAQPATAVSTFDRVYCTDISHDDCGHPNLTTVEIGDGFDGGTCLNAILRNLTLDFRSANHIQTFVKMFEPTLGM